MVVWIFAVSIAGTFFWCGDAIVASVFSGALAHDPFGLVRMMVGIMAFCAKYAIPIIALMLAYHLRDRQELRLQAIIGGAPRCFRCGRNMVFRTAAYGLIFWEHYWACPRCWSREEMEKW